MSDVPRLRERIVGIPNFNGEVGRSWFTLYGTVYPASLQVYTLTNRNLDVERTWDALHPGPPYRTGGNFHSIKSHNAKSEVKGHATYSVVPYVGSPICYWYEGGFIPTGWVSIPSDGDLTNVGLSGSYGSSYGSAGNLGADAWNRFKPKLSFADVAVFIGEFRDVPGMLRNTAEGFHDMWKTMGGRRSRTLSPNGVANQFLNYQFGWLPFLADVRKMINTTNKLQRLLRQQRRDNSRWIHRGGTISTSEQITDRQVSLNSPCLYPALGSSFYRWTGASYGRCTRYTKTTSRAWFEGAFKYYIPWLDMPNTGLAKVMNYLRAYGAMVNPSTLWELTPWSWLVDWSTNAGSVIDNFTSMVSENMVAKYAYVMKTTDVSYIFDTVTQFKGGDLPLTYQITINVKDRCGANPLGFSLTWDQYSPRQIAILGALGITRMPRVR